MRPAVLVTELQAGHLVGKVIQVSLQQWKHVAYMASRVFQMHVAGRNFLSIIYHYLSQRPKCLDRELAKQWTPILRLLELEWLYLEGLRRLLGLKVQVENQVQSTWRLMCDFDFEFLFEAAGLTGGLVHTMHMAAEQEIVQKWLTRW